VSSIAEAVSRLGTGPITESGVLNHLYPLFSRVLRGERERGEIYFANQSLGRPLDRMAEDVNRAIELWYTKMDDAWEDDAWMSGVEGFRKGVAKLIGLTEWTGLVPKTSAGQGLRAVLNALPADNALRPVRVVSTRSEFDSVDFILKTYIEKGRATVNWIEPTASVDGVPLLETGPIVNAIVPGTDLVVVSYVAFSTGQVLPGLKMIIEAAHAVGAMVLVDAYHAVGVFPVDMEALGVDFMIGGSYKYARGGPGACWLAIHPRHLNTELRTLDSGWFAKAEPFSYDRPEEPIRASGGDGWLESTPSIVPMFQALSGLEFTLALGVDRIRAYNLERMNHIRDVFTSNGIPMFVPDDPSAFGGYALMPCADADDVRDSLKRNGVNSDARLGMIRFGPDVLTTVDEIERASHIVAKTVAGA